MKHRQALPTLFAAALLAVSVTAGHAETASYKIDPAHSAADFSIRHMGISNVHGHFGNLSGTVNFDAADVTKSSVEATVDVTTVDTGVPQRDGHLKSPDFFDVAKYPTMTFKSTSVAKTSDGYDVTGDLTLHGVTKSVVLHLEAPGKEQTGMDGKSLLRGFTATTTIHRQDFGLTWKGPATKTGDAVLGDDVKVELEIEAKK
jgi:polyisoprenoid-binding protein YceI